jgi:HPt (histidine-containing phosphotransfer) domain-containing protein
MTEPVDRSTLAELVATTGDEPAFLAELIDTYLDDAPSLLAAMRSGGTEELRRAAHTLKSNSATFGARRLAELCRRLERGQEPADTLLPQIEDEYERVRDYLNAARPE